MKNTTATWSKWLSLLGITVSHAYMLRPMHTLCGYEIARNNASHHVVCPISEVWSDARGVIACDLFTTHGDHDTKSCQPAAAKKNATVSEQWNAMQLVMLLLVDALLINIEPLYHLGWAQIYSTSADLTVDIGDWQKRLMMLGFSNLRRPRFRGVQSRSCTWSVSLLVMTWEAAKPCYYTSFLRSIIKWKTVEILASKWSELSRAHTIC